MDDWDNYYDDHWDYDTYVSSPPRLDNWLQGLTFSGSQPGASRRLRYSSSSSLPKSSEADIDPLCRMCAKVELDPSKLSQQKGLRNETSLGTFDQARSRTGCPFCRLTVSAINEFRKESYDPDSEGRYGLDGSEEVEVSWWGGNVQGYSVNLAMGGARLCFVDEELEGDKPALRGRLLEGGAFSTVRLNHWMEGCKKHHGKSCEPLVEDVAKEFNEAQTGSAQGFRLIDVREMQIVEAPENVEYAALSYVWGAVPSPRLLEENKEDLMKPGGLYLIWCDIPKTIQDAINLTNSMELHYLWVDALCLIQDNEADVMRGVSKMKYVYGGSALTIIGAAGSHANVGLPGIRYGTRPKNQKVENVKPGIKMSIVNSLEDMLSVSYYSDRAWTFQEELLSQRTIIFTHNGGVFFRCHGAVWSEDTTDDKRPEVFTFEKDYLYSALWGDLSPPSAYDALLLSYTDRSLTFQSDAQRAFAGLEPLLIANLKCEFIDGIPTAAFDLFILFGGHFKILKRREGFASWSWGGWVGKVRWEMRRLLLNKTELAEWLEKRTWIVWYMRVDSSEPIAIRLNSQRQTSFLANEVEIFKSRTGFDNRNCPDVETSRISPTPDLSLPPQPSGSTRLQFWTLSLHLKFSKIEPSQIGPNILARGTLVDRDDNFCGSIHLDDHYITEDDLNHPFEFILLSKCWDPMGGSAIEDHPSWHGTRLGIGPYMWDLYWVMLIKWDETGKIAERRGLGQIYESAVKTCLKPGPAWKEIILG